MKRTFAILCIALLAVSTASAQITLGARMGLNMANIAMPSKDVDWLGGEFSSRMGINGGLVAEYALNSLIIQSGLIFNQVGAKYKQEINETDYHTLEKVTAKASYLTLPILVKYLKPMNSFGLYGIAGPYLGFFMGGTAKGGITGDVDFDIDEDIKDLAKSTDFGLILGIGIQKVLCAKTFFMEFRYTMGLSNALNVDPKDAEMGWLNDLEAKNKIFSINVGVLGLI